MFPLPPPPPVVTATVAVPVTVVLPLTEVAVIVAVPTATPVTSPVELSTVAKAVLLDANVVVATLKANPFSSFGEALSWTVPPAAIEDESGVTMTLVRTGVAVFSTVTNDAAPTVIPPASATASIPAEPTATPGTSPVLEFTVAMLVSLEENVTVAPTNGWPF